MNAMCVCVCVSVYDSMSGHIYLHYVLIYECRELISFDHFIVNYSQLKITFNINLIYINLINIKTETKS